MKNPYDTAARKHLLNLILNEDLIVQARQADADVVQATIATWSHFAEKYGSFADEYSTL